MKTVVLAALSLGALAGCGGPGAHSRAAGAVGPLSVRPVAWNASNAPVGKVRAVADAGDVVAVFSDTGATVLSSRAVVATVPGMKNCVDAATIAGADGTAHWIVGIDAAGRIHYLRSESTFDDVSERYGLAGQPVREASPLGTGFVGFRLDGGVAIADGSAVTRYSLGPLLELTGGAHLGAGVAPDGIRVIDTLKKTTTAFPLEGALHAAIDPKGRLYATTARAVYAANDRGELSLVYEADGDTIHGLVASGDVVWFADGTELGVIDGAKVAESAGVHVAPDAKLAPSSTGDVWVVSGGALSRFGRVVVEPALMATWNQTLAPIFARSCSACHLADGISGTDLSSAQAWQSERSMIQERVVTKKTMPPEGHALSDADREAIRAWAEQPSGSP
jgi:mono/diheme cytochrome c family protein